MIGPFRTSAFGRLARATSRRTAPDHPARTVDLLVWNKELPGVMTPISRPDALAPLDHVLPTLPPDAARCREVVARVVDELGSRDALDAGTPDALDRWIDQQLAGWLPLVAQEMTGRGHAAGRLFAVHTENLARQAHELGVLRRAAVQAQTSHSYWRDRLLGVAAGPPPSSDATPVAVDREVAPMAPTMPTVQIPTLPTGRMSSLLPIRQVANKE